MKPLASFITVYCMMWLNGALLLLSLVAHNKLLDFVDMTATATLDMFILIIWLAYSTFWQKDKKTFTVISS